MSEREQAGFANDRDFAYISAPIRQQGSYIVQFSPEICLYCVIPKHYLNCLHVNSKSLDDLRPSQAGFR
jgi:hypothetical protein